MSEINLIKCPNCGSSVIENHSDVLSICSHCGSKLNIKENKFVQLLSVNKQIKFLLIILVMVVFFALVLFVLNNQTGIKTSKQDVQLNNNQYADNNSAHSLVDLSATNTENNLNNKSEHHEQSSVVENEQLDQSIDVPTPTAAINISIVSVKQSTTINGGIYWIITLKNNEDIDLYRPGVVLSLYNDNQKRLDELRAWSKRTYLKAGATTDLLVLLNQVPKEKFSHEIKVMAKTENRFNIKQENLTITDFYVKQKYKSNKHVEIIGDVFNPLSFQVDFVEIIAVAKDKNGDTVGLANSFASISNLPSKATSGFKVRAGTFVTDDVAKWEVFAIGKKHR